MPRIASIPTLDGHLQFMEMSDGNLEVVLVRKDGNNVPTSVTRDKMRAELLPQLIDLLSQLKGK